MTNLAAEFKGNVICQGMLCKLGNNINAICSHLGYFLRGVFLGAGLTSSNHVWFQKGTLQEHVVVIESFVHKGQDSLRNLLGAVEVVIAIRENLAREALLISKKN